MLGIGFFSQPAQCSTGMDTYLVKGSLTREGCTTNMAAKGLLLLLMWLLLLLWLLLVRRRGF